MSMIEKIAEAIYERIRKGARHMPPWAEQPETVKDWHRKIARAAVESMREPTDEMMVYAEETVPQLSSFNEKDQSPSYIAWQAMIDKALEEKT